jgi:signal transduction histidine kinase
LPTVSNGRQLDRASDQDFPIVIATTVATAEQIRRAIALIITLVIVAALIAPFASAQLGRVDAFVPVLQTVLTVADLLTAILLVAQYSIVPQIALLAVASAYLCSASFAFLQTLTFPGGYAPAGLVGDGFNSPAWFFVLWHTTFPLGILIYALLKNRPEFAIEGRSAGMVACLTFLCVAIVVAGLAVLATAGVGNLPAFYTADIVQQTRLGNRVNVGLLLWYGVALGVLLYRMRTILDVWLIVVIVAWMPNFLVAAVASSVRFSLGWYAARGFALIASFMLLSVLLTEMTVLYSRLASAFALVRRERANRLMTVDAATAAIAHEMRTPLATIVLNVGTAMVQLRSKPPALEDVHLILKDIETDTLRASEVLSGVRALFKDQTDNRTKTEMADCVRQALSLAAPELLAHKVAVTTEFDDHAQVNADTVQLQQVILNLIRNAIDAMRTVIPDDRRLRLATEIREGSMVVLSVHDGGAGIAPEDRDRIFDAFFSTKNSGMGLGLALSRTIVESHGGALLLARSGPEGSTFEIALPVSS